ncbi:50S ribosomal protein L4 [Candidatus Roizmanbacteria bacterium]|nr:50S ribosomal protein L4 [Candidatus Roizmanbacteria bacterium]
MKKKIAKQKKETVKRKSTKTAKQGPTIPVFDLAGKRKKEMTLPKEVFSSKINEKLLARYVYVYLANQRQGTASTKKRGEIVGSKRKIWRQKGTGRARHGARSAPIFVGGGVAFGPKPKSFSLRMNKKQKRKALFDALTKAWVQKNILGLSKESVDMEPKTKVFAKFLNRLDLRDKKVLIVLPRLEKNNLVLAARNIPQLDLVDTKTLNAYEILSKEKIIFVDGALEVLEKHFLKKHEN